MVADNFDLERKSAFRWSCLAGFLGVHEGGEEPEPLLRSREVVGGVVEKI